jgi:hypothetical protein
MKLLNKLGGKHGVGRVDMVENRFVGMKSRGVYETPGGSILHFAHRQIESLTMDREVMHLRDSLIPKYATLVYNGFWYAPERLALQALVTESQQKVSGTVRLKLYKGNIIAAGRKSLYSLYNPQIATMEADPTKAYNQDDATGFIRLNGLRLKTGALRDGRSKRRLSPCHFRQRRQPSLSALLFHHKRESHLASGARMRAAEQQEQRAHRVGQIDHPHPDREESCGISGPRGGWMPGNTRLMKNTPATSGPQKNQRQQPPAVFARP